MPTKRGHLSSVNHRYMMAAAGATLTELFCQKSWTKDQILSKIVAIAIAIAIAIAFGVPYLWA